MGIRNICVEAIVRVINEEVFARSNIVKLEIPFLVVNKLPSASSSFFVFVYRE